MNKKITGLILILLSTMIMTVSAFVYEQSQQTVGQTIVNVATLTLKNSALGNIEEGETKTYTKVDVADLGAAVSVTTTKANVYLHFDSDIQNLNTNYNTYSVTVKYIAVPVGSTQSVGQIAATMTIAAPDPAPVTLDVAGTWIFDFEITTTAKSVSTDQASTATVVVTAEST